MPDRAAERLIANRYALEVPIGQGGMGVVWRARDTLLGREVAIKEVRLPPTVPESERNSMRARVLREARAAARLNHPAAVTLYDVINEQGHAFIVMELIHAPTLAQVVAKEGPLDPPRAAGIGAQVADALAAAHQAGIVHRDVKPANVMVVPGGGARLTDFGIARVKGDPKLTSTGLIVGSPAYMAPEQASGAAAGPPADVWSLGATLYFAVEGRSPFERGGSIATLTAVVNDNPRPAGRAGALGPVIAALLAKDPDSRPSAGDLRRQLERLAAAGAEPRAGATAPASAGDTEQLPEQDEPPPVTTARPPGKPLEPTRPGPSGPGHQGPAHVRPDQPARPPRSATATVQGRPLTAPVPGAADGPDADSAGEPEPAAGAAPGRPAGALGAAPGRAAGALGAARLAPGRLSGRLSGRLPGWRRTGGRLPLAIALLAVVALLAVTVGLSGVLRSGRQDRGAAAPVRPNASGTTRAAGSGGQAPPATVTPSPTTAPATSHPSGQRLPPDWVSFSHPTGSYSLAYPRGWRVSALSDQLNTTSVRGPAGLLFRVQSSSSPSDPMQAWTSLERTISGRAGYRRIRLAPGRYDDLPAAVWEFSYLQRGQRVHKLDVTFKSADGRWGYAVLLQAPEAAWSRADGLSSQFEQAFVPTG